MLRLRPAPAPPTRPVRRAIVTRATPLPISVTLVPTGTGSTDHLGPDEAVPLPPPIFLSEGLFELGREDPADIVLAIPTVGVRVGGRDGEEVGGGNARRGGGSGVERRVRDKKGGDARARPLPLPTPPDPPLALSPPQVSTRHAMLRVGPPGSPPPALLTLTDLGSTNGTYIIPEGTADEDGVRQLKAMVGVGVPAGASVVFGDAFLARFRVVAGEAGGAGEEGGGAAGAA